MIPNSLNKSLVSLYSEGVVFMTEQRVLSWALGDKSFDPKQYN